MSATEAPLALITHLVQSRKSFEERIIIKEEDICRP